MSNAQNTVLQIESRDAAGTGEARAIRRSGKIPAIVYGGKTDPANITIDPRDIMRGMNKPGFFATVIQLEGGKQKEQVIPKAVQFHPVNDQPLHADFLRVENDTIVSVTVPVRLLNVEKCRGLRLGGSLNVVRHAAEILCRADSIPDHFSVDISKYKIGDAIKSSAIEVPEGVKFAIEDREFTIATIAKPRGGLGADDEDEDEPTEVTEQEAETVKE